MHLESRAAAIPPFVSHPVPSHAFLLVSVIFVWLSFSTLSLLADGPQNYWTSLTSGNWQDAASWSLGILPAGNQSVSITDSGYKAVGISSSTVFGFPDSLTISNLTVSAPGGALSTLLLNYAGTSVPLHVLDVGSIGANGSIQNYYSSFQVDGSNGVFYGGSFLISDGGQFIQEGGLTVIKPTLELRNGAINATNATMNIGALNIGDISTGNSGNMTQSGGTVLLGSLRTDIGGYTLMGDGTLYILDKTILYGSSANFTQISGTNYGEVDQRAGIYHFYDGLMHGNDWHFTGNGSFIQHGGAAQFATMQVYGSQGGANYTLLAGSLGCGTFDITGRFQQFGGTLTLTNGLYMHDGIYDLAGGTVTMPSMVISNGGTFNHYGGINQVAGDVALYNTDLRFVGGRFSSANLGVGVGAFFDQYSGSNEVSGVLSITGYYHLDSGVVTVNGMYMRGTLTIANYVVGSDPLHLFVNHGLINFGGTLNISISQNSMGQLGLSANGNLNVSGLITVRFADSSALNWDPNSTLVINGWNGARIYFGSSASGLTPQQVAQIQFQNPLNHAGTFPATILSTGESVPIGFLASRPAATGQVLEWGAGTLQSFTNVTGPYQDVPEAVSPYTNSFIEPSRFFRLRQ